ncbi:MAG: prephenate dehydrogenase/arogenate dehydrogenase family protein [Ignavibacteriales bacterium]|nr:prephenate dehydrogenase/arogenate dehydrogenase family protein [Ignavibacteriales bacterium]
MKARGTNITIVGHEKDSRTAKAAQNAGAVDNCKYNLYDSVRDANIVILALPFAEVRETLELIASDLQEGTLILDTAPSKGTVAAWAKELLPQGRFYVGLFPSIHPDKLHGIDYGVAAASADLFEKSVTVVTAPYGTPENVFKLTTDLISLLGSLPLLMDTDEADGLLGKVQIFPQLAAAALLDATLDQPGWLEAKKLAGGRTQPSLQGLAITMTRHPCGRLHWRTARTWCACSIPTSLRSFNFATNSRTATVRRWESASKTPGTDASAGSRSAPQPIGRTGKGKK